MFSPGWIYSLFSGPSAAADCNHRFAMQGKLPLFVKYMTPADGAAKYGRADFDLFPLPLHQQRI